MQLHYVQLSFHTFEQKLWDRVESSVCQATMSSGTPSVMTDDLPCMTGPFALALIFLYIQ